MIHESPRLRARRLVTLGLCFWLGLPTAGMGVSALLIGYQFRHADQVAATERARAIAEGISEAMNWAAVMGIAGFAIGIPLLITGLARLRRLPKDL